MPEVCDHKRGWEHINSNYKGSGAEMDNWLLLETLNSQLERVELAS